MKNYRTMLLLIGIASILSCNVSHLERGARPLVTKMRHPLNRVLAIKKKLEEVNGVSSLSPEDKKEYLLVKQLVRRWRSLPIQERIPTTLARGTPLPKTRKKKKKKLKFPGFFGQHIYNEPSPGRDKS